MAHSDPDAGETKPEGRPLAEEEGVSEAYEEAAEGDAQGRLDPQDVSKSWLGAARMRSAGDTCVGDAS